MPWRSAERARSLVAIRASGGVLLLAIFLSAACVHRTPRGAPTGWPATDWIVNGKTGERATFDEMTDDLAAADVVFVGEDHGNPYHHECERRIAAALVARKPTLGMGMEMLQTTAQPVADRWIAGEIDLDELVRRTDWKRTWGFPIRLYKPLFDLARERKIPLFALNAPEAIVSRVREVGVEGLTPEEHASIPDMDLDDAEHQAWVRQAFGSHHSLPQERFLRFYSIQVLWDETMAERTLAAVRSTFPPRPMVVFAGTGHLIRRMGIPSRLARRDPGLTTRVVLALPALDDTPREIRASVHQHDADWLWITPDAPGG